MEIANLLNLTWRRAVILVLLIGIGGATGFAIASGQSPRYDGDATILVSDLVGIDQPDYLGQSYSKSIRDLVVLDRTLRAAGKSSEIDVDGATIDARVDDGGTTITVEANTADDRARDLAVATGRAAIEAAAAQQVPFAERGLELAQERLDEAIVALETFDVTNGTNIADDPDLPQTERDQRAELRTQREQLSRSVDTAQRRVDDATGRAGEAKLFADRAGKSGAVVPGSLTRESTTKAVLRTAGAGAAAGLALGLALLVMTEARRRRRAASPEPEGGETSDVDDSEESAEDETGNVGVEEDDSTSDDLVGTGSADR